MITTALKEYSISFGMSEYFFSTGTCKNESKSEKEALDNHI